MSRHALVICLAVGALLISAVATAAPVRAANDDAAHLCQQGGYLTLTRSDGTGFKNAGECTSYAARGGQIVGVGAVCTVTANSGCIILDQVTIREASVTPPTVTYVSDTTYTLSGTLTFTPTCQNGTAGCSYATITITGAGTFSASEGTTTLAAGAWTASYQTPDPYSFTDGSLVSSTCATAEIQMVTARLALTSSVATGGAWVEVRLDSSTTGPTKTMVLANFYTSGLPSGDFHTSDVSGVTLGC
jgi:hypothetical protein